MATTVVFSHRRPVLLALATAVALGVIGAVLLRQVTAPERTELPDATTLEAAGVRIRSASVPAEPPPLDCDVEGYPCSWSAASEGVWQRSVHLASEVSRRFVDEGPGAARDWLAAHAEVVAVRSGPRVVGFRLDGGRFTWVGDSPEDAAPPPAESERPSLLSRLRSVPRALARALQPTVSAQVVGRDRNGDGKVNQRDVRRAAIVAGVSSPQTTVVAQLLESSPAYAGNVETKSGWQSFLGWDAYDIVHVVSRSVVACDENRETYLAEDAPGGCQLVGLFTGDRIGSLQSFGLPQLRRRLGAGGRAIDFYIEPSHAETRDTRETNTFYTAYALATLDFLSQANLSTEPRRQLVFLDSPHTDDGTDALAHRILGAGGGMLIAYAGVPGYDYQMDMDRLVYDALVAGRTAVELSLTSAWLDELGDLLPSGGGGTETGVTFMRNHVRGREIVALIDASGQPLADGMRLPFTGTPDDGEADTVTIEVRVEGIVPERLGTPAYPRPATVWLELDGQELGMPVTLTGELSGIGGSEGSQVSLVHQLASAVVRFDKWPLETDVTLGHVYELEAVFSLPGLNEEGVSRYAVDLVPGGCYWEADVSGTASDRLRDVGVELRENATSNGISLTARPDGSGPNELTSVTFGFNGDVAVGSFRLGGQSLISLWAAHTLPVSYSRSGQLDITYVERAGDGALVDVAGRFSTDFSGMLIMPDVEGVPFTREGPLTVTGEFSWRPGCTGVAVSRQQFMEKGMEGFSVASPLPSASGSGS